MKFSSLCFTACSFAAVLHASSVKTSKADLSELELEQLVEKKGADLAGWLNEKRMEYDGTSDSSSLTTEEAIENASSESSPKSSKSFSVEGSPVSKFDQKMLISLSDALRSKNYTLAVKLIQCIPNWKMTFHKSNFSVLSLIASISKKRFLGKLYRNDSVEMFRPLIDGSLKKASGGYFLALYLFHPTVQIEVMTQLIENATNLRGILLINSIYFNLHEDVIRFLLSSGAFINFAEDCDDISPIRALPRFSRAPHSEQHSITKRLFMNFYDGHPLFAAWERHTSPDPEINFLMGMSEVGFPEEVGALRVAFEKYSPEIVMSLVDLSPFPVMTNYHLAHLLAKNPEKRSDYPPIESLVDSQLVFDRLMNGETDLVGLAFISSLPTSDQVLVISEFMAKTKLSMPHKINESVTTISSTSKDFRAHHDIYEFPSSPANVFFLTACKWNIADEAFALLWDVCKGINNKHFYVAKKNALEWAINKKLDGKIAMMS